MKYGFVARENADYIIIREVKYLCMQSYLPIVAGNRFISILLI